MDLESFRSCSLASKSFTFKTKMGSKLPYRDQLQTDSLASKDQKCETNLLSVARVRTCFGSRSFSVAASTIWNSLPFDIRYSCSQ